MPHRPLLPTRFPLWTMLFIFPLISCLKQSGPAEHPTAEAAIIRLETLDLSLMKQDWEKPRAGKSVNGGPISIGGMRFEHGLGSHAFSILGVDLGGEAQSFEAQVGVNDEVDGHGTVRFQVWLDGKKAFESDVLRGGQPPLPVRVDLRGAKTALFVITVGPDRNECDHADWAEAIIRMKPGSRFQPRSIPVLEEPPPAIIHATPPEPAIHGPRIVGATPGRPFLHLIPATGEAPLTFSAENLPEGLALDPATGIITGSLKTEGKTDVVLRARNARGIAERRFRIVAAPHSLALTPPMGWNSWNIWGPKVDDRKIREAADAMIQTGLANYGFQYINIDDAWEGPRAADGEITTNENFPDMAALGEYIHALGLKFGIYSSPGPMTCQKFPGSYGHELQDARTFSKWGVDFLKYDWCYYSQIYSGNDREELIKPYRVMREALDQFDRDIVYSLCQYGMGSVWEWGPEVHGNLWRTAGDIADMWGSMAGIGFSQNDYAPYAAPGHWNDPDMLVVGWVGWGQGVRPNKMTPNEQLTHITLWSLLAAPMLLGCDLTRMDDFTLALLTNPEVLDVNQDILGRQATRRGVEGDLEVWARPLADGTVAAGLFNRGFITTSIRADWPALGISGTQPVRDLWLRKDLGEYSGSFSTEVPPHGAVMIKIGRPRSTDPLD